MSTKAKADHEILLTWREATGVLLHPPKEMKLGETVHYHSKRGEVEVYFRNRSPFGSTKKEVDGNDPPLKLKVRGDFKARCYITTPKGVKLTYKDGIDRLTSGGGNMHVS
jgi:hypothetical protein